MEINLSKLNDDNPGNNVSSLAVERALIILKYLSKKKRAGIRELSRDLGYNPSIIQKTINALHKHDFVHQDEATKQYSCGFSALQLGLSLQADLDIVNLVKPYLMKLTEFSEETTFLATFYEQSCVYLDKVVSPNSIRMDADLGEHRPINCTAVGKILLAYKPTEQQNEILLNVPMIRKTPYSIIDRDVLLKECEKVRNQGFAIDNREYNPDGFCIAVPIYNRYGEVNYSITVSGLATRTEKNEKMIKEKLIKYGTEISELLGYEK